MSNSKSFKRWIALLLSLVMVLGTVTPAATAASYAGSTNGNSSPNRFLDAIQKEYMESTLDPNEMIRVSIVLEKASTIEAGYSTIGIANNKSAMSYRDSLRTEQETVQAKIERKLGKELDVVWNLTLAANIISANVRRGDIAAIKAIDGVESVYVEKQYSPDVVSVGGTADPNMAVSGKIDGAQTAWLDGLTGEGTLIAIIDTGLDIDHQSFDNDAFLYAVNEGSLKLTETIVKERANRLNATSQKNGSVDGYYRNEKIPFGWNYIDKSNNITHLNDAKGEHGSHVAGIAAANRYIKVDGEYVDALDAVKVAGNAPDAQIMVMKVFGAAGGAFDSDCAAAIEDAIILDADVVNLSLGMALPGFAAPQEDDPYAKVQQLMVDSDTVVVFSAGNAGSWAEYTSQGYLYNDGVSYQFDGESGSYTNSFTVASVDNAGFVGSSITANGTVASFNDASFQDGSPDLPSFGTLDTSADGSGTTVSFVMLAPETAGTEVTALAEIASIVKGKVAIVWRGSINFSAKAQAAFDNGAIGTLIANNASGGIIPVVDGYTGSAPVAGIYQTTGDAIWAANTDKVQTTESGVKYIVGEMVVKGGTSVNLYDSNYYTMSNFSSWGTTGDLALKPEISAFGGSIYSVWGANSSSDAPTTAHDQYELMSGTSMAAPQITGMAALVQQYLRREGYDKKVDSVRAVTQGLLMATAEPMKDANGNYYSLLQQGAGLANVLNAVSSPVYITVKDQDDGKVKAELGDDILNPGVYVVEFDIHNFTDNAYDYTVSAEAFTQKYFEQNGNKLLDYSTRALDTTVEVSMGEADAQGNVHVVVTIKLTADEMEKLETENPYGAYIEAFVFVQPTSEDGAQTPKLSIPVLAYHGNWTDASMFEIGDGEDWYNRTSNGKVGGRYPYSYGGGYTGYDLTLTNVLIKGTSISKTNVVRDGSDAGLDMGSLTYIFSPIRNYGNGVVQITDDKDNVLWRSDDFGAGYGITYYENAGFWLRPTLTGSLYYNLYDYVDVDWAAAIKNVGDDVTEITISLILAPEYYAQYDYDWDILTDGDLDNGELGVGAILSTTLTLDQEAPEIVDINVIGDDPATRTIEVKLADNKDLYVARLYDESGDPTNFNASTRSIGYERKNPTGTEATVTFNGGRVTWGNSILTPANINDGIYRLEVEDKSGNLTTKRFIVGDAEFTDTPDSITLSDTSIEIVKGSTYTLSAEVGPYNLNDDAMGVNWTTSDPEIATVDENGVVTAVSKGTATITASTVNNGADGNPVTAECTVEVFTLPIVATGILGDANGYAKFFEWDFEEGVLSYSDAEEHEVVYPQAVAPYEDGTFLAVDGDGTIYVIDAEGNELRSSAGAYDGMLPYDMDYTEDAGFWWTLEGWLMSEDDPFDPQTRGFNLSSYGTFIGLVIDDDYSFDTVYQGSQIHIDRTIYLLSTKNVVYEIYLYNDNQSALISTNETDLTAKWVGYGGESYSNMVLGADGNLYVSIMTGDTNEVYQLSYWEEEVTPDNWEWGYTALYLGNFGDGVWPGLFLTVENAPTDVLYDFDNDGDVDADDAQVLLRAVVRETTTEDMDVNKDGKVTTRDVYDLLVMLQDGDIHAVTAPVAAKLASIADTVKATNSNLKNRDLFGSLNSVGSGDAEVTTSTHTVVVPVKASDVNNGLIALNYDNTVLTYSGNETIDTVLTHVYAKDDTIRVGFAGLDKLAADTVVAEITFTYEAKREDRETEVTISVIEEDDTYNDTPVTDTQEVLLPGETFHSYNLTGVLTDESFSAHYFTWNTDESIEYANDIPGWPMNPVTAINISDTEYYIVNYDLINDKYDMYLVSKETGEILDGVEGWAESDNIVPWDMTYVGDDFGMWGTYGYYIIVGIETEDVFDYNSVFNLSSYGYPYFLGIDVVEEPWTATNSGVTYNGDRYILAIDDSGYVWKFMPYKTATGSISALISRYAYTGMPDLYDDLAWATNDATGSSMVVADDGTLFFSYINPDSEATSIYRLVFDGTKYVGELIGETDYWVYPALLLEASVNHVYGEPEFTWSEDGKSATATFTCEVEDCDESVTVDATVTSEVKTEATCEDVGTTTYTATVEFEGETYTDTKDVDDIPAIGHSYGEPEFTWSDDGKTATAIFTCENDSEHTLEVEAEVTGEVTAEATCEENGTTTYTATVEFEGETYTDTNDVDDIPATDHDWSDAVFNWSEDGKSATVTFTCENDSEHTITVEATVTSEVTTPATEEEAGTTTYTATVELNGVTYTDTKDVQDIPALDHVHVWGEPEFTWSEDGKSATATFICELDPEHTETVEATVTSEVKIPATEEEAGTTTYTATVELNGVTYTDTKDVQDIPVLDEIPNTSDNTHIDLWIILAMLSLLGMSAVFVLPRKALTEGK